jgi:uncharacterized protein YgiM (DUF1202 family)
MGMGVRLSCREEDEMGRMIVVLAVATVAAMVGAVGAVVGAAGPAVAATGDVYAVNSDKLNLRAAPSDSSQIRSHLGQGLEVVELRRDGPWLGVRVLRSGEEGWLWADYLKRSQASTLGGAPVPVAAAEPPPRVGFGRLSEDFDSVLARIDSELGYHFAERVEQPDKNSLHVVPTREWAFNTSREAKLYATLALYEMWKAYNNGRPVSVALGEGGSNVIALEDTAKGPQLTQPMAGSSR